MSEFKHFIEIDNKYYEIKPDDKVGNYLVEENFKLMSIAKQLKERLDNIEKYVYQTCTEESDDGTKFLGYGDILDPEKIINLIYGGDDECQN